MELNNLFIINIINSGISLIMGFYMFLLQRNSEKQGVGFWAAGSLVIGLGLLFKAIAPMDSYFYLAGFPVFITLGLYLYLAGIWRFKEQKVHTWIIILIPGLDLIQSLVFFSFLQLYRIQIALHLLFIIIYCTYAILEMLKLKPAHKYLKKIFFLNAFIFAVFLSFMLLYAYALLAAQNFCPFELSNISLIVQVISGFVMIALTFGFLSAVHLRLTAELEDQLKSKTKFLSIIGHDLKGPIGNIMNFLDLLQNKTDINEKERKQYIRILNTLSQSTFHLLQNLLEWASKSKNLSNSLGKRIDLSEYVSDNADAFKSMAAIKSINIEIIGEPQVYVFLDLNMLETTLRNLVSNAVKFTPKGGSITITTEKTANSARLVVSDTGKGIKAETIHSLLKFETNKPTAGTDGEIGSGIGLALCKQLVHNNNGVIRIESKEDSWTKVIIEFPFVK